MIQQLSRIVIVVCIIFVNWLKQFSMHFFGFGPFWIVTNLYEFVTSKLNWSQVLSVVFASFFVTSFLFFVVAYIVDANCWGSSLPKSFVLGFGKSFSWCVCCAILNY